MAALGKEKEKDKEKEKGEKEGGTAKRKEREDNFPVHEDDIPRAIITRMVKAKVALFQLQIMQSTWSFLLTQF